MIVYEEPPTLVKSNYPNDRIIEQFNFDRLADTKAAGYDHFPAQDEVVVLHCASDYVADTFAEDAECASV